MNRLRTALTSMALAMCAFTAAQAQAMVLLEVDLSVVDQITITATSGTSAVTTSGSTDTGFYLEDFFGVTAWASLESRLISDDLTSFENTASGVAALFRNNPEDPDPGLNVYAYTSDLDSTFTRDEQAFSGSATWSLGSDAYAQALAGADSGDIYFAADYVGRLSSAEVLGTWAVVPEPSVAALVIGGLVFSVVVSMRRSIK